MIKFRSQSGCPLLTGWHKTHEWVAMTHHGMSWKHGKLTRNELPRAILVHRIFFQFSAPHVIPIRSHSHHQLAIKSRRHVHIKKNVDIWIQRNRLCCKNYSRFSWKYYLYYVFLERVHSHCFGTLVSLIHMFVFFRQLNLRSTKWTLLSLPCLDRCPR